MDSNAFNGPIALGRAEAPVPLPAALAAALHDTFCSSEHGSDSIELWLDIAAEATRLITVPTSQEPCAVPIFAIYGNKRTNAVLDPHTSAVYITSGRLTGTHYPTPVEAARAVIACATGSDGEFDGDDRTSWRLPSRQPNREERHR
ncbi:hypothetical protein [Nocardia vulneris]|uniref:hypothetical protein n=1 Tax=Nocardia vulneris TaxID=1141657 RepID=UPI0005BC08A6|nr:hypothetical protein [Nocardia vulneris]